jgi:hypothetical protein
MDELVDHETPKTLDVASHQLWIDQNQPAEGDAADARPPQHPDESGCRPDIHLFWLHGVQFGA